MLIGDGRYCQHAYTSMHLNVCRQQDKESYIRAIEILLKPVLHDCNIVVFFAAKKENSIVTNGK